MNQFGQRMSFGFGGGLTPVVKKLLIANFAVYILHMMTIKMGNPPPMLTFFALTPAQVTQNLAFWQLVTYQFLHSHIRIFHILFNMFALWMFGCEVERHLGPKQFLKYYLFTGIGAGIFFILFNWNSPINIIGASGAIYGVLVAFAVLFPNRIITLLLFFVLPISLKAKHLVAILIGISIFSGMQGQLFGVSDGVAHLAHLGGALVGFLLLKSNDLTNSIAQKVAEEQFKRRTALKSKREENHRSKREEIDRILDRINEVGYKNISEKDKATLKKASEHL
jgi:membrane associated rhomboid family serine protease